MVFRPVAHIVNAASICCMTQVLIGAQAMTVTIVVLHLLAASDCISEQGPAGAHHAILQPCPGTLLGML